VRLVPGLRALGGVLCLALGVPPGTVDAARAASAQFFLYFAERMAIIGRANAPGKLR
jgi:hypothetical protein